MSPSAPGIDACLVDRKKKHSITERENSAVTFISISSYRFCENEISAHSGKIF